MAVNALQYVKNVGKSFGYSAIDALKEYNPQITALASGAKDFSSELYDTIEDFKGKIKGTDDSDEKGLFDKARNTVKDYHDNLLADLKSGNWYNKERINAVDEETMKNVFGFDDSDFDLDDWDFDFDDDESETEVEEEDSTTLITSTQKQTANAIIETMDAVGSKSTNAIANATVRSADYVAMSQKQSSKAIYSLTQKGFGQVETGLAAINANISTLVTLGEPLTTHMQNSATFYTQSAEYQKSVLEKLDEIVGLIKPEETSKSSKKATRLGDLITSEGVLDLTGYFDFVKGNVQESMSEVTDMLDMVGGLDNLLKSLTASPMKTATDAITRLLIPNVVQSSMEQFNQSLASFFPAAMDRLQSTTFGGIFDSLKDYLFPKRDFKQDIDTSQYKHGKVDWTGESEMALKEVIPTYLAAITSALTGGPMTQYDYKRGQFVTISGVKNLNDTRMSRQARYAGGDFRSDALAAVRALGLDKDSEQYLTEGIENYFLNAFKNGANSATKIKNNNFDYKEYGMNEESLVLLREILKQYEDIGNTYVANQFASDIRLNQEQYSDEMRRVESENGVERALFNNSDVLLNGSKTQAKGAGGIIGTDKNGNDIFFYLQGIYQYTGRLANNYHLFGVSVPTDNTEITSTDMKLWLPNSEPAIPNNNPEEKKEASKQLSEIRDTLKKKAGEETTADVIRDSVRQQSDWRGDHRKPGQKKLEEAERQQREKEEMEALGLRYNLNEEQKKSLADTLKEAEYGTGAEGYFNKIRDNVTKLFSMPGEAFASILSAGERSMYNLIFGKEGSEDDDGLFGYFYKKADNLFDKFDNYFGEKMGFSLREWAKQFFNSDFATDTRDELKDAYKWLGSRVSDFTGFKGAGKTEELTLVGDTNPNEKTPAIANDFAGIQLDARGRRVTKTGVVAVSEGELIIPSDYNPYYHGSNNKQWQLANENRARNQFYGNFAEGGTVGETKAEEAKEPQTIKVKTNAKGIQHYVENKEDKPEYYLFDDTTGEFYTSFDDKYGLIPPAVKKRCKKLPLKKRKNGRYDENVAWDENGNLDIGRTKRNYSVSRMSEGKDDANLLNVLKSGVYKAINSVQDAVNTYFPKDKKEEGLLSKYLDKAQVDALKSANLPQEAVNNKGAIGAGALIGAGASLLTGAVIGPFAGAAIGAGVGLIVKSDSVQKALFGDYEVDKDGNLTNTRSGGLLSKDISNFIEKNVPSMATGATIGGVAGMFMGSPILGAIVGSAVGYATKSDAIKDALFGKVGEDGNRIDSGIISKQLQDNVKKALPNIGAGALAGLMFGPLGGAAGLVGNVILGSALGYASASEEFKDILLGKPDKDGKRQGGIVGDLRGIFFGYEKDGKQKEGIVDSVIGIFQKVGNEIGIDSRNLLKTAGEELQKLISGSLGNTFTQWLTGTRTGRFIGGAARTVGRAAYGVATAPLRAGRAILQGANNALSRRSLRRGFNVVGSDGKMMTGGERLEEAEKVGLEGGDYRLSAYDEALSNIESREDLDTLLSDFDQVQNPELQYSGMLHNQRTTISHLLSRYRVDGKKAMTILKAIDSEKLDDATKLIQDLKLPPEQEQTLLKELGTYQGTITKRGNAQSDAQAARERILNQLGLTSDDIDLTDRNEVDKLRDLAKAEGKRLPELTEEEKAELDKKKKEEAAEERQKQDSENLGAVASSVQKLADEAYDETTKSIRTTQVATSFGNGENPAKEAVDNTEGKPKEENPVSTSTGTSLVVTGTKRCPNCGKIVNVDDNYCKFCDYNFNTGEIGNPEAANEGEIPNNEASEEGENNNGPKVAAGAAAAGLGIGHRLLNRLTGVKEEGEDEPQRKTVFNMFGDAIQKVRNKQGEWVDDLSDQETKESTKSNGLLKEGLGSLSHLGATIGGAFGKLQDALFGSTNESGEKKQGLLSKLFDQFFGEGSYESGIFGMFSKLFGGMGIVKTGKKVLRAVKDIAPGAALIAVIAGAITGKFDDLVAKLTGNELADNESQFIKDKNGVQHRLATDEEGNFIQDEEGNYLADDGTYVSGWIEEEGTNTSLSSQLQKNLATAVVTGGGSVAGRGIYEGVKIVTKGKVDLLDAADALDAAAAAGGGYIPSILNGIQKFLSYIPKLMANVPILNRYADNAQVIIDGLFELVKSKLAQSTESGLLSKFSSALSSVAPYLQLVVAVGAAINGAGEAEQYFEVKEATMGQKVISALVAGLNTFIPYLKNLIPNKTLIQFFIGIADKIGIDMTNLKEQQAELQADIDAYNYENGTDLSTEEYLETVENKGGIVRKVKNFGSSVVTNVKEKGVIGAAGDAVGSVVSSIGNGIKDFGSSIMSGISGAVSSAGDWIMDKLKNNPITNTAKMIKEEQQYMQELMDNPDSSLSDMFKFDDDEDKKGLFSGLGKVVRIGARISYFPSAIIGKVTSAIGNKISELFAPIKNSFAKYNSSIEYIDTLADTGDVGAIWDYDYSSAESEGDTNGIFDGILSAGIFIKKVAATPVALFHKVSNSVGNFIDEKLSPFKVNIAAYNEANEKLEEAVENGDATKIMDIEYEGDEEAPLNGIFGGLFNVQKVISTITTFIAHPFKSVKSLATNAAGGLWDTVKNFFSNNSDEEVVEAEEELYDNGENANGNVSTRAGLATVSKGELIVSAKDNPLSGTFDNTSSGVSGLLGKALQTARNLNPFDEANVRETLSSHGVSDDKIDKAVNKINNLKGTASNIANDIKGIVSDSIDKDGKLSIGSIVSNTADLFTGKMQDSDNKIISTAGNVISNVKDKVTDTVSTIKDNGGLGLIGIVGNLFKSFKGNEDEDDTLVTDEEIEEQDEELEEEYEDYEKAIDEIQKSLKDNDFNKLLKVEYKGDEDSPLSGLFKGMFNIQKLYNAAYALIAQPFESTGGGSGNSSSSSSSSSNSNSSSSSSSASATVEESSQSWISKLANGFKSFFGIGSGSGLKNQVGGDSGTDERFVSQTDDKYKNIKYANSKIGDVGCGPAAATMMINNAQPGAATMKDAIKLAKDYESPGGTNSGYFEYALGQYGLPTEYIDASTDKGNRDLKDQIANGQPAVLLGRDPNNRNKSSSPFGPSEHYVVATGMDKNGNVIINDPEARRGGIKYNPRILNDVSLGIAGAMPSEATDDYKSSEGGAANVSDTAYSQAVWGYLTSRGYSPQAAAGIMGNMYQESGVNPTVIQGNGKGPAAGIVQWENYNNKSKRWGQMNEYAQSIGKDWTDLDTQLKFMDAEFTGEFKDQIPQAETWVANLVKNRYGSIEGFKNLTNIDEATKGFEETFEQAGKPAMQNRYDAANAYYNLYNGSPYTGVYDGSIISGTSDGTVSGTSSSSSGVGGVLDSIKNVFKNAFAPLLGSSDSGTTTGTAATNSGLSGISGLGGEGTEQQQQLIKVLDPYVGTLAYSQKGARNPEQGSADCSSTVNWAYKKVVGDSIGDDTLSILNSSKTTFVDTPNPGISKTNPAETSAGPNINNLEPGDLMLYSNPSGGSDGYCADRPYRVGHVEMYAGNGQRIGHGSDGGPRYTAYDTKGTTYIGAKRYNPFIEAEQNTNKSSTTTNQNTTEETTEETGAGSGLGNVHMPSVSKMTGQSKTKKSSLRRFSGGASGVDEEDTTEVTTTDAEARRNAKAAKDANNEIISLLKTIAKAVQSIASNTEDIPKLGDTLTDYCQAQLATSVAEVKATATNSDSGKVDPSEDAALRDLMNTLGAIARG